MNKNIKSILEEKYEILFQKGSLTLEDTYGFHSTWSMGTNQSNNSNASIPHPGRFSTTLGMTGKTFTMQDTGAPVYQNTTGANQYNYIVGIIRPTNLTISQSPILIADRLWSNTGIDISTGATGLSQNINSTAWPPRDDSGLTNGYGVQIGLEVGTTTTQTTVIQGITALYTNTEGVSGKTGRFPDFPSTALGGAFVPMNVETGDKGVKSVESILIPRALVNAGSSTGSVHLVAYRPLAYCPNYVGSDGPDFYNLGFTKIHNDSHIFFIVVGSASYGGNLTVELVVD